MQLALRADSYGYDPSPTRSPSARRSARALVAGVAMASATVIAVNPVTPTLPDIQQGAVQLTAIANPLVQWQQTFATTFANLQILGAETSDSTAALAQALSNPEILAEVIDIIRLNVTNPLPLLTEIINFPANHGEAIGTATQETVERLQAAFAKLPTTVVNTLNYLATGQFVEAFSEADVWFVLDILGGLRPLIPLFSIPSEIAENIPGAQRLPALLNVVSEFGLTRAAVTPFLTAAAQTAEILDATRAALTAGDIETAVGELVNLPAKVINAFVNGYTPGFSTAPWAGMINGGLVDYLLVTLPNQISAVLTAPLPDETALAATASTALAPPSATEVAMGGETVTLDVETESAGIAASETVATATDSSSAASVVDASSTETDESAGGADAVGAENESATEEASDDDAEDAATATADSDSESDDDTADTSDADDDRTQDSADSETADGVSGGGSSSSTSGDSDSDSDGSGDSDSDSGDSGDSGDSE